MGQEKRMMLAIALSIAVLLLYQYFMPASPPKPGAPSGKDNAAAAAGAEKADIAPQIPPPAPMGASTPGHVAPGGLSSGIPAAERQIEVRTPLFTARISTAGGGITSFLLTSYKDAPGPDGKMLELVGSTSLHPLPLSLYTEENRPPSLSP